jgi:hypothetical protein
MGYGRSTNPVALDRHRLISLARQRALKVLVENHAEEFASIHDEERRKVGVTQPWKRRNRGGAS